MTELCNNIYKAGGKVMKKATKVTKNAKAKKTAECPVNCCSLGHKIWGAVALAGLFACGLILGLTYRPTDDMRQSLDVEQCDAIANEIVSITQRGATAEDAQTLDELNAAYSDGCAGRLVIIERAVKPAVTNHPEIISTCARIEQLLKYRLNPEDSTYYLDHLANADTYSTLADKGCAENTDMYKTLALRELEIATALQPEESFRQGDAEIVIDTFKKLDMQREAQAFLNKIEKLIDPATDFILQMEQIINE